jgi:cytochrome c-type protein NapC
MTSHFSILGVAALAVVGLSALFLFHHLLFRPALKTATKVRLLLGLGVFPIIGAVLNTAEGMHKTTTREFCGSCHVMGEHLRDVENQDSLSLASRHGRNKQIGESNCYICHADYGMLGYPLTKITGMKHVYYYYLGGYAEMPIETAVKEIHINKPYPNSNCMQCHSGKLESWRNVREHQAMYEDLVSNKVACASAGCHGYSHPFSKEAQKSQEHAAR